jgi:hypothetical protein
MKTPRLALSARYSRRGRLAAILSLLVLVPRATLADSEPQNPSEQSVPPSETRATMPAIGASAGDENDGDETELPPGHPPIDSAGSTGAPADSTMPTHGASSGALTPSSAMPAGTIEVHVVDDKKQPSPGVSVILQIHRESVSEGNTENQRDALTDAIGIVRFERLSVGSSVSYRLQLSDGGARYGLEPFQLTEQQGVVATIHRFPLVRGLDKALVAAESMVFVEPKDNVFQFEVVYRLYNVGQTIWVPDDVQVQLPGDRQAMNIPQSADDVRVEASTRGIRFVGAVPPGQHEVSYTFQVPRSNVSSTSFELGMPPNVMQARVGVTSSRTTELTVEGFQEARPATMQNGQRLLLAMQTFDRVARPPTDLRFEIRGLPTLDSGRVVAAVVASVLALMGLAFAMRQHYRPSHEDTAKILEERARRRLLDELAELENAKVNGSIGPKTYEETRNTLVEALIRLEPLVG